MGERYRDTACSNLQQVLIEAAEKHGDLTLGFVNADGTKEELSFAGLFRKAKEILSVYREKGVTEGKYLIIATDNNYQTICHFWAAILGGIIPTILQPPFSFNIHNPAAEKLYKVYQLLEKPHVVIPDKLNGPDIEQLDSQSIIRDNEVGPEAEDSSIIVSDYSDTAYLQFSSGSTGDPKGVMLTHSNILENIDSISDALKLTHDDVSVNWMPLYHDMGLIGYHITPVYIPLHQLHIETTDFIKDPFLWLRTMSEEGVNITGCPNFGQALINRHMQRKEPGNLDLSSVRAILNGAEPISPEIMESFMENLSVFNLNRKAMMPVYGMAEATLAVTFNPMEQTPEVTSFKQYCLSVNNAARIHNGGHEPVQRIVNVGKPIKGVTVAILDKNENRLKEGFVGEVCVKGKNVSKGYYRDRNKFSEGPTAQWLRTGDQGFILFGDLYITGRYKDIIFINGRNFYANDLESYAIRECELMYGKFIIGGYFNDEKGRDSIIAFLAGSDTQETRSKFQQVSALFISKLGIHIDHFVLVRSNQIPKTSSGKIKRYKIIQAFQGGELKEINLNL
jgi:acyl-CoA synthetase (AMP-forming)/AMP-acid ligase II